MAEVEDFYGGKQPIDVSKILIQNDRGEFLMLKKGSHYDWMAGKWEQPGGKFENDEDRFEAIKREVETETGLELGDIEDLVRLELEESGVLVNCYVLFSDDFSGEIELSDEHEEFEWVSKEEIYELDWHRNAAFIIPVIKYLEDYRETEIDYGRGDEIEVVKLLIRNDEGKFLITQKTAENKVHSGHSYTLYGRMAGKWELPGGKFKQSSDRFDASRREILEETGLELGELKDVMREEIEEKNRVNTYIILCDEWNGEVDLSKEHVDHRWVSAEEYLRLDWHQDAGYGYPPMKFLDQYI